MPSMAIETAGRDCSPKRRSCPVPSGIIKAIEVAAGLALPKDASIQVSKEED